VLLPFLIHTDSPEKVCVQLTHLNESVTLSATLEYQGENRSLIDDVVSEKDVFTCIPFSVSISSAWAGPLCLLTSRSRSKEFRNEKKDTLQSENSKLSQTKKRI